MTREELQPGRYYRIGLGCNTTLFQFKSLSTYKFEIYIYKGIRLYQETIDADIWTTLYISPDDDIEEIDEKTFDKVFKQFSIAKTSILTTLRVKKSI